MPGWLRRLVAPLERRWIRNPEERERHDELVKRRIAVPDSAVDGLDDPTQPADGGVAAPSDGEPLPGR